MLQYLGGRLCRPHFFCSTIKVEKAPLPSDRLSRRTKLAQIGGCVLAAGTIALVTLLRVQFPQLADNGLRWSPYLLAVVLSTGLAGRRGGITAALLAVPAALCFPAMVDFGVTDILSFVLFVGISLLISTLNSTPRQKTAKTNSAGQSNLIAGDQYRALADTLPQLVWITDGVGQPIYFNRRWQEYTGHLMEDIAAGGWPAFVPAEDQQRAVAAWNAAVAARKAYEVEYRIRSLSGSFRWFLVRAVPIVDTEGELSQWFGTCTDIHDRLAAELAPAPSALSNAEQLPSPNAASEREPEELGDYGAEDTVSRLGTLIEGWYNLGNESSALYIAQASARPGTALGGYVSPVLLDDYLLSKMLMEGKSLTNAARRIYNDCTAGVVQW